MSGEQRQAFRRRLGHLASGTHEGPLGPEDIEALRFMASVYEEASHAAWKLWTMYSRGETQRKAELDWLIGLFQDPEWTGVDDPPDPQAARARAAAPELAGRLKQRVPGCPCAGGECPHCLRDRDLLRRIEGAP